LRRSSISSNMPPHFFFSLRFAGRSQSVTISLSSTLLHYTFSFRLILMQAVPVRFRLFVAFVIGFRCLRLILTFSPSMAFHLLWLRLTSALPAEHSCSLFLLRYSRIPSTVAVQISQGKIISFPFMQPLHILSVACTVLGFCLSCNIARFTQPCMQFLFVDSNVCRQLPSDSQSPATPLLLANDTYCNAHSGLAPYSL
jgi:hypothetical protein